MRVRSKATGLGTYADATVICGAVELDPVAEHGFLHSVALDVDLPLSDIYRDPMALIP